MGKPLQGRQHSCATLQGLPSALDFQEQVGKLSSDPDSVTSTTHSPFHPYSHPFPALQSVLVVPMLNHAQALSIHKHAAPQHYAPVTSNCRVQTSRIARLVFWKSTGAGKDQVWLHGEMCLPRFLR